MPSYMHAGGRMSSLQLSQSVGVQCHPIFKPGVEDRVFIGHRRSEETAMIYVRRAPECRVFSCHNLLGGDRHPIFTPGVKGRVFIGHCLSEYSMGV